MSRIHISNNLGKVGEWKNTNQSQVKYPVFRTQRGLGSVLDQKIIKYASRGRKALKNDARD